MSTPIVANARVHARSEHGFLAPQVTTHPGVRVVSASERARIEDLQKRVSADIAEAPDWAVRQARMVGRKLPANLLADIYSFRDLGSDLGAFVLQGLPVGPVPETPADNRAGLARQTQSGRIALIIVAALGDPVAYEAEGNGHLIQDMVPSRKHAYTQQSQGSKVELECHTEQAFSPVRPDWVVLSCLRGDPHAATYLFTAKQLCAELSDAEVNLLRQPLWTTTIDESFKSFLSDPDQVRGPMPILAGPKDDPAIVFDQDLMHGIDSESERLVQRVIEAYRDLRTAHFLAPGEIVIVDNGRTVHGRSTFVPKFDGSDRFIGRLMAVRDRFTIREAILEDGRTVAAAAS